MSAAKCDLGGPDPLAEMEGSQKSILIVDDDADARFLNRRLIAEIDPAAAVVTVSSAGDAMAYLLRATNPSDSSKSVPTFILLDLHMPGKTGFDLLRWIRRNQSLSAVKVIMISTSDAPADLRQAAELGAHAYLLKFPSASALAEVMSKPERAHGRGVHERPLSSIHTVNAGSTPEVD